MKHSFIFNNLLGIKGLDEFKSSDFIDELKNKYLNKSKINKNPREGNSEIKKESQFKLNFKDERTKLIKLSNDANIDVIEDNSFIKPPRKKNFKVKNEENSHKISSSVNQDYSQIKFLNDKDLNPKKTNKNNSQNKNKISNSYNGENYNNNQSYLDQIIKERSNDSKNYFKRNRNFLNYLNNPNNNLIDLNSHNNDIILPSTSEMIKISNQDLSSNFGVNRKGLKRTINNNNFEPDENNFNNYNQITKNQNDISKEKYVKSNVLKTRKDSYSPIPKNNLNSNMNSYNNEYYNIHSSIKLPNINQNNISKSINDTSINKRPISMIKSNSNNEYSIENSRVKSYRKKSPYYFNDPKLNKLIEERNHNIMNNKKFKNLINLSESNEKHYNNYSRINHNNKSINSIDNNDDYEIL